jgi:hypothetical protein
LGSNINLKLLKHLKCQSQDWKFFQKGTIGQHSFKPLKKKMFNLFVIVIQTTYDLFHLVWFALKSCQMKDMGHALYVAQTSHFNISSFCWCIYSFLKVVKVELKKTNNILTSK